MSDWTTLPLGLRAINLDRRRVPVTSTDRKKGPYPYYGASGVVDHVDSFIFEGLHLLVAEDGENLRTRKTPVAFLADGQFWVNNHAHVLIANEDNDIRFLAYAVEASNIAPYITGSTQPKLSQAALNEIPISAPPLEDQLAIVEVLGSLDRKIASNGREVAIATRLVQALFIRAFGQNELSLPLGELAGVVDCLHTKKPAQVAEGHVLLQLENIRQDGLLDRTFRYPIADDAYAVWSRKFETTAWDLVITNVGRVGAVARIPEGFRGALGRNMTGLRPHDSSSDGAFILAALLSGPVRREIELNTDSGTIMNALNVRTIPFLRLPRSSAKDRAAFQQDAGPLLKLADRALQQIAALNQMRDTLMPELLSGRLRPFEALEAVV